jgi:hypothetical protein
MDLAGQRVAPLSGPMAPHSYRLPPRRAKPGEQLCVIVGHTNVKEHEHMTPGRVQIRPLGGWSGCLMMILFSLIASVVGTVLLNLLLH